MSGFKYTERGEGVYYIEESIAVMGHQHVQFLKSAIKRTAKGRVRLCVHRDESEPIHEMFILVQCGEYIRPHRHHNKPESLCAIEGAAEIVLFSANGDPVRSFSCGVDEDQYYYRISEPIYHTVLVQTPYFIFHETTKGPFRRVDTEYAPWAPSEDDVAGQAEYTLELRRKLTKGRLVESP